MFNLLIAGPSDAWAEGVYEFPRERVAIEYTEDSISERYRELDEETLEELKEIPSVFGVENEESESRVGYLTSIKVRKSVVRIEFSFDSRIAPLARGFLEDASIHFELGRFELNRTHWAIKEGNLFKILEKKGLHVPKPKVPAKFYGGGGGVPVKTQHGVPAILSGQKVFVVHGHDEITKFEMADAIRALAAEPIILHEQVSGGLTIIEKIERYTDVEFGVVLYTPCDIGGKKASELVLHPRARQNVVFEHGYLIGKLGRKRVMAFVKGKLDTPTDISGVVYVDLDADGAWKKTLEKEMKAAGYKTK